MEKWKYEGMQRDERIQRMREQNEKGAQEKRDKEQQMREREKRDVTKIDSGRSVFRFQDIKVDERVGEDGRGRRGVGARYGFPHEDRKKGQIKIPTRVS